MPTIICVKYLPKNAQKLFAQSTPYSQSGRSQKTPTGRPTARPSDTESDVNERLFDNNGLSKIGFYEPYSDCECPNHIAKLIIDICAFEEYCKNCEGSILPKENPRRPRLLKWSGKNETRRSPHRGRSGDNIDLSTL